jgi:hypothetical protein
MFPSVIPPHRRWSVSGIDYLVEVAKSSSEEAAYSAIAPIVALSSRWAQGPASSTTR